MAGTIPSDPTATPVSTGEIVDGRYLILNALGSGTFGEVFAAQDVHESWHQVAIKLLRAEHQTLKACRRFEREATLLQTIKHRNIVSVYGRGVFRGRPYFVMERVEGRPLGQVLDEHRSASRHLTMDSVRDLFLQLCAGVGAAHRLSSALGSPEAPRSIAHCDLKPANIMLSERGGNSYALTILDFGIARIFTDAKGPGTAAGLGSPGYMAPEQACGDATSIGAVSDVYALGVLLIELLTLKRPAEFLVSTGERRLLTMLRSVRPNIPEALGTVLSHALSRDPALRPADAHVLWHEIRHAAGWEDPPAEILGRGIKAHGTDVKRRNPKSKLLLASLAGALLVAAIGLGWQPKPVPRIAAGAVLLVSPSSAYFDLAAEHVALCRALRAVDSANGCVWAPLRAGSGTRLRAWSRSASASLVVILDQVDSLTLDPSEQQLLPLGSLPLKGTATVGADSDKWTHLSRVLTGLSRYVASQNGKSAAPIEVNRMEPALFGEAASLLAAYVRYVNHGARPPGSEEQTDLELAFLHDAAQHCQSYSEPRPWWCTLATYLYPNRCDCLDGVQFLRQLAADDTLEFGLRRRARLRASQLLCRNQQEPAAAAEIAPLLRVGQPYTCDDLFLVDAAVCITAALSPSPGKEPALDWLAGLTDTPIASFSDCARDHLALSLSNRGYRLLLARQWERAARDLAQANAMAPLPSRRMNLAESLLGLPHRRCEVLDLLNRQDALKRLDGVRLLRAFTYRWLVARTRFDAIGLLGAYEDMPAHSEGLSDGSGVLRDLACGDSTSSVCEIYEILRASKSRDPATQHHLRSLLLAESWSGTIECPHTLSPRSADAR